MSQLDPSEVVDLDVAVVGAGFGGLYALHRFREMGLATRVFEAGEGVGGTWFWNRYPGARCDVESLAYSYHFSPELEQEWSWSERYASQPEILRYANHVADRFDLRRDIQLGTRVASAIYDEADARWLLETGRGQRVRARFCVMTTGCLSSRNLPPFPGLERFQGESIHTGDWPEEGVDLAGKRVGIVGTGSTAIQAIPILAEESRELFVFQRTPNFSMPARNSPMDPRIERFAKRNYAAFRAPFLAGMFGLDFDPNLRLGAEANEDEKKAAFEDRWALGGLGLVGAFADLFTNPEVNEAAARFIRGKIHDVVDDPDVADLLSPHTAVGCKRPCADSGYYKTFNRSNVHLVDISEHGITEIRETGICVGEREIPLDTLVFATGFDAMTGALLAIDPCGRRGRKLSEAWADGPRTYLGLCVAGFPNLFTVTGPGSPSVLANMIPAIEQHVDWIAECIRYLETHEIRTIEARHQEQDAWMEIVQERAERTIYPSCNSWYMGANIPGKARTFMVYLGFPDYVRRCDEVAAKGYGSFDFDPAPPA